MKLEHAELKAKQLIEKYRLDDYTFQFDGAVSRFGYCNTEEKVISLSRPMVELNTEKAVEETILHEIAHALTPGQAHNEVWKRVARAIGDTGERCYDDNITEKPSHKWIAECPKCKREVKRFKRNKNLFCGSCFKKQTSGRLSKEFKFRWIRV